MSKSYVPVELVAMVTSGAAASGIGALLTSPVLAPLWGALVALLVAFVQAKVNAWRTSGKVSASDRDAVAQAVMAAAHAGAEAAIRSLEARNATLPPPAPRPSLPVPPVGPLVALLALGLALGAGCGGVLSPTDYARGTLSAVAASANAAGDMAIDAYCVEQLHAAHREGHRVDGRCVTTDGPARVASATERAAVGQVVTAWHPVFIAADEVASAHELAISLVEAGDDALSARFIEALARITEAYTHLAEALGPFHVSLPPLLGH